MEFVYSLTFGIETADDIRIQFVSSILIDTMGAYMPCIGCEWVTILGYLPVLL